MGAYRLVGRARSHDEASWWLDRAAAGRGCLLVVSGSQGSGRTSFAEAIVEDRTAWWSAVRPADGRRPLGAWRRVLGQAGVDIDLRGGPATGPDPAGLDRFVLFDQLIGALARAARARPAVVVLDDVHLADPDSLDLLDALAGDLPKLPLAVVVTVLTGRGASLPRADATFDLAPLDRVATGALLAEVLGAQPAGEQVEAAWRATEGNPFQLVELARLLREDQQWRDVAAWSRSLPDGVHSWVAGQLSQVGGAASQVLVTAGVLGGDADPALLAAVVGRSREEVQDALDVGVEAGLLRVADGRLLRCRSELVREALAGDVPPWRLAEVHRAVADHLLATGADAAAVAMHLQAAGPGAEAAAWSLRAAAEATEAHLHADAVEWLQAAVDMGAGDADVLVALAEAETRCGRVDAARMHLLAAVAEARRQDDAVLLARAALGIGTLGGGFEVRLLDVAMVTLLEEALEGLGRGEAHLPLRVRLLARLSVALTLHDAGRARRVALAEEAVALARGGGDDAALAIALGSWCDAHAGPEDIDERLVHTDEMLAAAVRSGEPELELLARRLRIVVLMESAQVALARREVEAFALLADALRRPELRWYARVAEGMLAGLAGDLGTAWEKAQQAAADGRAAGSANAEMLAVGALSSMIRRAQGDLDGFVALITEGNRSHHEAARGSGGGYAIFLAGWGADRPSVAAALQQVGTMAASVEGDALHLLVWSLIGDAAVFVDDAEWALRAEEQLVAHEHRLVLDGTAAWCHGPVAATLGRLARRRGDTDEARRLLRRAVEQATAIGAPLLRNRIAVELAELERTDGDLVEVPVVGDGDGPVPADRSGDGSPDPASRPNRFVREGDTWLLRYRGVSTRLRDRKGLHDLATLLERAGQDVHVLDLVGGDPTAARRHADGSTGPALDASARAAYESRIRDLTELLEEAEEHHDLERAARLEDERSVLLRELAGALGLSGRPRPQGSDVERARKAVSARIRDAIAAVDVDLPELGHHLRHSVSTGIYCAYRPERRVDWS